MFSLRVFISLWSLLVNWFSSFFLYNTTRISFSMSIWLVNSSCFEMFSFDWEDSFSSNTSCTLSSMINVSGARVREYTGAGARVESDRAGGAGPGVESAVSRNTRKISYCKIFFFFWKKNPNNHFNLFHLSDSILASLKLNPNNSERKFVVHRLSYKRVKLSQLHLYITKENLRPFIIIE